MPEFPVLVSEAVGRSVARRLPVRSGGGSLAPRPNRVGQSRHQRGGPAHTGGGDGECRGGRCETFERCATGSPAWLADHHQGLARHRGNRHHRRHQGSRAPRAGGRCAGRRAPPRCGRGAARQEQHPGAHAQWRDRQSNLRPHQQPVRLGSLAWRQQRRRRRHRRVGRLCTPVAASASRPHFCGIAGIKPTTGRVPRTGHIVPYGLGAVDGLTQIGPMARYVEDLALALPIISGVDWHDPSLVPMPLGSPDDVDFKGLRIATYTDNGVVDVSTEVADAVRAAADALTADGASRWRRRCRAGSPERRTRWDACATVTAALAPCGCSPGPAPTSPART